ncbi:hypothetical protein, partial [Synechococcus lacustris]|uniref:hypothetical protein n=1 Tax=Synechococcus lacustris TaxID=2116544 RepID=UPI00333E3111
QTNENGNTKINETSTLIQNIIGTNGPVYQHIQGLPSSLGLNNFAIEWVGGYVPMATSIPV